MLKFPAIKVDRETMVIFIIPLPPFFSREGTDDERNGQNTNRLKINEMSYRKGKVNTKKILWNWIWR